MSVVTVEHVLWLRYETQRGGRSIWHAEVRIRPRRTHVDPERDDPEDRVREMACMMVLPVGRPMTQRAAPTSGDRVCAACAVRIQSQARDTERRVRIAP